MDKDRNYFFDNVKALLIFLVIFAHVLEFIPNIDYKIKLKTTHTIIYYFHMPLFIFVSGYFAKLSSKSPLSRSYTMFVKYIFFQVLYTLFYAHIIKPDNYVISIVYPNWTLWYLLALSAWHMLSVYFENFNKWFIVSLFLSSIVGLDRYINAYMSIARIITFLPFFIAGYYFNEQYIIKIKRNKVILSCLFFIISAITYKYTNKINVEWLYGSVPFQQLTKHIALAPIYRTIFNVISFISSMTILSWVSIRKNIFSFFGKITLIIYLTHSIIIRLSVKFNIIKYSNNFEIVQSILTVICVSCIVSTCIYYVKRFLTK